MPSILQIAVIYYYRYAQEGALLSLPVYKWEKRRREAKSVGQNHRACRRQG